MSRQAQAERERQSRIILSTAETEIAAKFEDAARYYRNNPVALHLRAMNMVAEGLKQKGSMIIVPSTAVETMGLGAMGGLTAFDRFMPQGGADQRDAGTPGRRDGCDRDRRDGARQRRCQHGPGPPVARRSLAVEEACGTGIEPTFRRRR